MSAMDSGGNNQKHLIQMPVLKKSKKTECEFGGYGYMCYICTDKTAVIHISFVINKI